VCTNITVSWDLTLCGLLKVYGCSEGTFCLLPAFCWLFNLFFSPEDIGGIFIRNAGKILPDYTPRHIPEDSTPAHLHDNVKSNTVFYVTIFTVSLYISL
jgi:hypothetical protein